MSKKMKFVLEYVSSHFAESKVDVILLGQEFFHDSAKARYASRRKTRSMLGKFSYARKVCFRRAPDLLTTELH